MKYTTLSKKISIFIAIITSFIIVACGGGSGGGGGGGTPAPAPITGNFVVTAGLAELDEAAKEIKYTLELSTALDSRVTVRYEATNDTAQSGQDFTATKGTATIEIGERSITFSVPILDDNVVEQTEQFSIVLSDLKVYKRENGAFILDNNSTLQLPTEKQAPVKIRDDDTAELTVKSYTPPSGKISEGEALVVSVTSTNPIEVKDGLKLNYTGVPSSEFIISGDRIASGASNTELRLLARADGLTEGTEDFNFNLADIDNQIVFGRDDVLIISGERSKNITVTDRLTVGFISAVKREILENGTGELIFKVGILSDTGATYNSAIHLNATTSLTGGSAEAGDLKTLTGKTATIAAGETSANLRIAITNLVVDDNLVELGENFFIELTRGANFPDGLSISTEQNKAEVEILNDDTANLTVAAINSPITEPDTALQSVNLIFRITSDKLIDVGRDVELTYRLMGTAIAGTDYTSPDSTTVVLPTGSTTVDIPIAIIGDNVMESAKTLTMEVLNTNFPANIVTITDASSTATILDSDRSVLSLISTTSAEEGTAMTFTVESSNLVPTPVTVSYTIAGSGTYPAIVGTEPSSDLETTSGTAILDLSENTTTTFTIATKPDSLVEANETFTITLAIADSAVILNTANNSAIGTILNDDRAGFNLTVQDATIAEGNSGTAPLNFAITLANNINIADYVEISATPFIEGDVNAEDYTTDGETITLASSDNFSGMFTISIIGDTKLERDEGMAVTLNTFNSPQPGVTTNSGSNVVTSIINNDDSAKITVAAINSPLTEPGTDASDNKNLIFRITTSNLIEFPVELLYSLIGTATADEDYITPSGTISLPNNTLSVDVPIAIKGDDLIEASSETLKFTITSSPVSSNLVDIADASATAIIKNDPNDRPVITLSRGTPRLIEGGDATFTVSIAPTVNYAYNFQYTVTSANSSVTDTDFSGGTTLGTAVNGTIPANSASTMITITTNDDSDGEENESFIVTISDNIEIINIGVGTVAMPIVDNDLGEVSNVTGIIDDRKITLNWDNPNSTVFASVTIVQTTGATAAADCTGGTSLGTNEQYVASGLTNGTGYSFRICTVNNDDSPSSGVALNNIIPNIVDSNGNGLIEIATANQLNDVRNNLAGTSYITNVGPYTYTSIGGCNDACRGYELMNDIDIISISNWVPIGASGDSFIATFHGRNRTISNLTINSSTTNYVGLFGAVEDATISSVKLANVSIEGNSYVGALAGYILRGADLTNIELFGDESQLATTAEVKGNGGNVGGLVGWISDNNIIDSSSGLTVRGGNSDNADKVGGLAGHFINGNITNSNNKGAVLTTNGVDWVGGLVGHFVNGNITNSNSRGAISATGLSDYIGGLVGHFVDGDITNSNSSSDISTGNGDYIGGLVGNFVDGDINDANSSGAISATGVSNYVGGLVGNFANGEITNSNSSGAISATGASDYVGGLVGNFNSGAANKTITNASSNGAISVAGGNYIGGLVGNFVSGNINDLNSGVSVTSTGLGNYIGGLVGYFGDTDTNINTNKIIANASNSGAVSATGGSDYVGGLVGYINGMATITNSHSHGAVASSGSAIGGLIGHFTNGAITNSSSKEAVSTTNGGRIGGLVGDFLNGAINDSSSSGAIAAAGGDMVGGLVGNFANGTITKSSSLGNITTTTNAVDFVGGLVGLQDLGDIKQSWARGNVSSSGATSIAYGGLVGQQKQGDIEKSWATGNVYGNAASINLYGGLVGEQQSNTDIRQSWASGNVSGNFNGNSSYGGLVGEQKSNATISQSWASGNVSRANFSSIRAGKNGGLVGTKRGDLSQVWATARLGHSFYPTERGGLVGVDAGGSIIGRNYQLDNATGDGIDLATADNVGESFDLYGLYELSVLSGADGVSYETHSNWHAGFSRTGGNVADDDTMYCDIDNSNTIEPTEQIPSNSVWVMGGLAGSDIPAPTTNAAGVATSHHSVPVIRCIGDTPAERLANINLQRRQFPVLIDKDRDGLIDVTNDTQFNNIRHNLAGTGYKANATIAGNGDTSGCPNNVCRGYELLDNIDLSGYSNWTPIGSDSDNNRFRTTLEGNNHTISNLTITGNNSYVGLFGVTTNANIRNFKITNVSVKGAGYVGALVGEALRTNISNIVLIGDASQTASNAEVQGTGSFVGGLVGAFNEYIFNVVYQNSISNSSSNLTIKTTNGDNVGGLVGFQVDSDIRQSWASGFVFTSGGDQVGGLVGWVPGKMNQNWASGNVTGSGSGSSYGGLMGSGGEGVGDDADGGNHKRQHWAAGAVTSGGSDIGGLVGYANDGFPKPRNYKLDTKRGFGGERRLDTDGRNEGLTDGSVLTFSGLEALANLSGAEPSTVGRNVDYATRSGWHARNNRFCDINYNGRIDAEEQTTSNSVWVMGSDDISAAFPTGMSDNFPAPDINGDGTADFYAIPALRCGGNTEAERKANIDRQRRQFPIISQ